MKKKRFTNEWNTKKDNDVIQVNESPKVISKIKTKRRRKKNKTKNIFCYF